MGWGGQELRVLLELEWMREHGHWVALAAPENSALAGHARNSGIEIYPLRTHKSLLPVEALRLGEWMVNNDIEVVNTHSSNDGWLAGIAARIAREPMLIRSRHIEVDYPNRFWSRIAFRRLPHRVITTSQRIANRLVEELGVPASRVNCISTGVDLELFKFTKPGTLREEIGLPPEVAVVGMSAVLRSWKGHATFLDAVAEVLGVVAPPVHFVIAGDGPGLAELTLKVSRPPWDGRVTLLRHRPDVPNVLSSLDVLVLPSYAHEGIPQIILQAQAMSRPVVATTVGGIPEVIEDGVTGMLVPPRNAPKLAEDILLLLENPELREFLGRNARESVEKHHSVDAMGEKLLRLYSEVEVERKG
jgi:glycosyltransferase involved in cell wall biosynthesis